MNRQSKFQSIFLPYLLMIAIVVFTAMLNATSTRATDFQPLAGAPLQAAQIAAIDAEAALPVYAVQPAAVDASGQAEADTSPPAAAARTEFDAQDKTGDWQINIAALSSRHEADEFIARIRAGGIDAAQHPVLVNGRHYWRVSLEGFQSQAEAEARATQIAERLGLGPFWVSKAS